MAEFSRIRVTPAEEEDIVIVAGAVDEPASAEAQEVVSAGEALAEEAPVEEATSVVPRERGVYEETTLEDLQHAGMSGMQKAIIALAIVAVAAFIIWYVLLR